MVSLSRNSHLSLNDGHIHRRLSLLTLASRFSACLVYSRPMVRANVAIVLGHEAVLEFQREYR